MKTRAKNSGMLTTTGVAHFLGVHPGTMRQWANRNAVKPGLAIGGKGQLWDLAGG